VKDFSISLYISHPPKPSLPFPSPPNSQTKPKLPPGLTAWEDYKLNNNWCIPNINSDK